MRQHVVDGAAVVVLLDVDGTDIHGAAIGGTRQLLLILAPLAAHQVEGTEAEHDGLAELGEEHAHKADAGEVADATHAVLVFAQRDAELVPLDRFLVAVAQRGGILADVSDVVMSQAHVFGADAHPILIVALILVERKVLVDVLHVGVALVAGVVALGLLVAVGRVALRHVDALVALQDGGLAFVEVAASEVVVVVVGRVVVPGCSQAVVDADAVQEVSVGGPRALLAVSQSVQSDVL